MSYESSGAAYGVKPRDANVLMGEIDAAILDKALNEPRPGLQTDFSRLYENMNYEEVKGPLHLMCEWRPKMNPIYAAQLAIRAVKFTEARAGVQATDAESQRQILREFSGAFRRALLSFDISTTKGDRIKVTNIYMQAMGLEEDQRTLADFGCGANHGPTMLALAPHEDLRYSATALGRLASGAELRDRGMKEGTRVFIQDEERTNAFDKAVNQIPFNLNYAYGIDRKNPYEAEQLLWIEICSITADEQTPAEKAKFDLLTNAHLPNVRILSPVDFAVPFEDSLFWERIKRLPGAPEKVSVALFSFSTYQLRNHRQGLVAIQNALDIVKEDGSVVVLDAVTLGPNTLAPPVGPDELKPDRSTIYHDNRKYFAITFNVLRKDRLEEGFKKYMTISDGRISQVILNKPFGELPLAREMGLLPIAPPRRINRPKHPSSPTNKRTA